MTSTLNPAPHAAATGAHPYGQAAPVPPPVAAGRAKWPLWGAAAAIAAFAAVTATMPADLEEADYISGVAVVDKLEAGGYRIGFYLGLIAFGCLVVAANGWRRWAQARAPRDLTAGLVGQGLAITATVSVIFYGITGAMGLYLPGGAEEEIGMSKEGLFVNHTLLDFGSLLGWWGAALSAVAVAVLAFRKDRLLPRWMGVVSIVFLLPAVGLALATSLPGLVGFTLPMWLLVTSIGMVFSKQAQANA